MTLTDPWASAPAEPAAEVVEPTPPMSSGAAIASVAAASQDLQERLKSPKTEIVTTFKEGTGFDSAWIVLHAPTVEESDKLLDQKLADYFVKVKRVAAVFRGGAAATTAAAPSRPLQPGQPAGSVEAPSWAPAKPHPDFVYVTKVSPKTGKPWHAWMAPEKNDNREPVFFNAPR